MVSHRGLEASDVACEEQSCPGRHKAEEQMGHSVRVQGLPCLENRGLTCPASNPCSRLLLSQPLTQGPSSLREVMAPGTGPSVPC